MYNLIIIDDEAIIRNGLNKFMDWNSLNIQVVELFEDGREAIEFLKGNDVDIVLTDIKMPDMSGIDVAKFVYETKPMTRTVILSGYKEFALAQKAIEYKVQHYLLKPTNFPRINEVFQNIVNELDEERNTKKIMPLIKSQYINDIIFGVIKSKEDILKRGSVLGFGKVLDKWCALMVFSINDFEDFISNKWNYGRERFSIALANFFSSKDHKIKYYNVYSDGNSFYIFAYEDGGQLESIDEILQEEIQEIIFNAKNFLGFELMLDTMTIFDNFYELATYNEKISTKDYNQYSDNALKIDVEAYRKVVRQYKLFFSMLNEGKIEEMESLIVTLFNQIEDMSFEFLSKVIIDLFAHLSNKFSMIDMDIIDMTKGNLDYNEIINMKSVENLKSFTRKLLSQMADYINEHKRDSSERVIEKAILYINDNYHEDISLEDVANHVFLNAVYFCRFFKKRTNENFTEYLVKVRIEHAMELIDQGIYKTYEISEKVGYKSSKYFSRVFKQFTGMSPSDYGRRHGE